MWEIEFVELSWAPSDRGEFTLMQLTHNVTGRQVYEIRLDGELVTSSETGDRERAHVRRTLDTLDGRDWDVVLCGLGLGFAAAAVLDDDRVRSLLVLEPEEAIIEWCRERVLPTAKRLIADPRAQLVCGDLLPAVAADRLDPHAAPGRRVDALLVDAASLGDGPETRGDAVDLTRVLRPGGVLTVWSDGVASTTVNSAAGGILQQVFVESGTSSGFRVAVSPDGVELP